MNAPLLAHIALFGKTFVAQKRFKVLTVELAGHSLEIVVVQDGFPDRLVTDGKAQLVGLVIECRLADEAGKDLPVKT